MRHDIHVTTQNVDDLYMMSTLFSGLDQPARGVQSTIARQNGNFHLFNGFRWLLQRTAHELTLALMRKTGGIDLYTRHQRRASQQHSEQHVVAL